MSIPEMPKVSTPMPYIAAKTAAFALAQQGHLVCLVERSASPRLPKFGVRVAIKEVYLSFLMDRGLSYVYVPFRGFLPPDEKSLWSVETSGDVYDAIVHFLTQSGLRHLLPLED